MALAAAVAGVVLRGGGTQGVASLQARPWGAELHLRLRGLPAAESFEAYAVAHARARIFAASWGLTANGRALVPTAIGLSRAELFQLGVQTRAGDRLLVPNP